MKKYLLSFVLILSLSPAAVNAASFSDVSSSHWASPAIQQLAAKNILAGYVDGTFKPLTPVTKGQAIAIIDRYVGSGTVPPSFSKANPNALLTRAEAAQLVTEGFNIPATSKKTFSDVPASHWAHNAVRAAAGAGIIEGESANAFDPNGSVTRAYYAVILTRAANYQAPKAAAQPSAKETAATKEPAAAKQTSPAQATIAIVNQERKKTGAGALKEDPELSRIAQAKAEDMAKNDYFDHNSPTYGSPFDMAYNFGYSYQMFGENIAVGHSSAKAVMAGWMDSKSHRENLLKPGYTFIGIGYAKDQNGTPYWVHMFSKK